MSPRRTDERLQDILAAADDIAGYLHGSDLSDGRTYAACRMALIEIGEAARHLDEELLSAAPEIDWRAMIGMRNFLVHHYFDTDHAVVAHVIDHELGPLRAAVSRLQQQSAEPQPPTPPPGPH